ncbi:MAG: type II toxin-antitoxin system VapC family toxin [Ignavibacteria bacterium]|nr:type II toxin-antitoxin system VapC family toxin [Ignavibacteria bacterium]
MIFVADTDVLIDFLRDRGDEARRIELELKTGRLCTSAVSAFELWVGATSPQEKTAVGTLLGAISIIPLDAPAANDAGEVFRTLKAKGITIGMADSLIAGICLSRGAMLITRNKKHFSRVQGLKLSGDYRTSSDD